MARHHRRLIPVIALAVAAAVLIATVGENWNGDLVALGLLLILVPAVGWTVRRDGEALRHERHPHRRRPADA